jgi:hypothetical protein
MRQIMSASVTAIHINAIHVNATYLIVIVLGNDGPDGGDRLFVVVQAPVGMDVVERPGPPRIAV